MNDKPCHCNNHPKRRWDHRLLDQLDNPTIPADEERDEYLDWQR